MHQEQSQPLPQASLICVVTSAVTATATVKVYVNLHLQEAVDYGLVQMVRLSIKTGGAGQVSEGCCSSCNHHTCLPWYQNSTECSYKHCINTPGTIRQTPAIGGTVACGSQVERFAQAVPLLA
jgi:hypothetical protein